MLTKELRLAKNIVSNRIRDRVYYPGRLFTETMSMVARGVVLLFAYHYAFSLSGGSVHGVSFSIAAWSIVFYFVFGLLGFRGLSRLIMQDVQSGGVEMLFAKPVSYIWYRMWWQIGSGLYPFVLLGSFWCITLALTIGIPETMHSAFFLMTCFATLIVGAILSLCLYTLIGLCAFWIEDINPIHWMVDKSVMILGGSYVPVALFPPIMQTLAKYTPFGASQFITHTVYASWQSEWVTYLGMQTLWMCVALAGVGVLFHFAKKKVSVNGG